MSSAVFGLMTSLFYNVAQWTTAKVATTITIDFIIDSETI